MLIVGAGLSGIGAACRLQTRCPDRRFAILEGRDRERRHLGPVPLSGRALRFGHVHPRLPVSPLDRRQGDRRRAGDPRLPARHRPRVRHRPADPLRPPRRPRRLVERATPPGRWRWSATAAASRCASAAACFSCAAATTATTRATRPRFPGEESFGGRIVHPQQWTDDIEVAGKRIVVIGSGATAVTLVPALAQSAAQVTMLQRSPTWMVSRPSEDRLAKRLRRVLPLGLANAAMRWQRRSPRHVLLRPLPAKSGAGETAAARRRARLDGPGPRARAALHAALRPVATSASAWCPTATCSAPCAAAARRSSPARSSASPPTGVRLVGGEELAADLVVTATGLTLQAFGGAAISVDGRAGRLAATPQLQGGDVQRRAQPGLGVRLHQRLVDAEVGPDRRVRLPPARAHEAKRHAPGDAAQRRPGGRRRALARPLLGLRAALAAPVPAAGLEAAVAAAPELRPRPGRPALDPGRRRRARVLESAPARASRTAAGSAAVAD